MKSWVLESWSRRGDPGDEAGLGRYSGRMSRDHRKLRAFELADELVIDVYRATARFPPAELYGIVSQMRRAAVSVPTNIVEGCARRTQKEFVHFLVTAFASLREVGYLIGLSHRLGMLKDPAADQLVARHAEAARVLAALIRKLDGP